MVSGGMTCVKYLLFIFNLLFVISGIAIISVGAFALHSYNKYQEFVNETFAIGPIVLIAVGSIIFVVAFFGCCGAVKENHCMVVTFAVFLMIIFCIELAAGICGYIYRDQIEKSLREHFQHSMEKYADNNEVQHSWDVVQHDLECCGMNSSADWQTVANGTIPSSCCKTIDVTVACTPQSAYENGCLEEMKMRLNEYAVMICGVGIGIALVQLVGVIFACCLAKSIRKEYETV